MVSIEQTVKCLDICVDPDAWIINLSDFNFMKEYKSELREKKY
jgi:hypothetical protein